MASVVAPSNIRALPAEVYTENLDPMKPGGRQQFWYTVLGLGLAVGAFFTAWRLHGSASSTYRVDNQWSALTGLFILALAIELSRRLTAVVTWGVATGLGFLLCAVLNITLMQAVRANGSGQPPFWADLLVTGLVVGAGTKPLHDLVANIERGKSGKNSKRDSR